MVSWCVFIVILVRNIIKLRFLLFLEYLLNLVEYCECMKVWFWLDWDEYIFISDRY